MPDLAALSLAFADAWNRHDLEAIMARQTEDCAFWSAAGTEAVGGRHEGQKAVRAAYQAIFETYPDGRWTNGRITVLGQQRVLSEWLFIGTMKDGKRVEVEGLDLLEFEGEHIRLKNSFRKQRAP
jgi:ketosteroid isomerase-like protein